MTLRIDISERFIKSTGSLPPDRRKAVGASLRKFQVEPRLPSLRFRPLQGAEGYWIISSAHGDRIILRRIDDKAFEAVDVGPHDNVYRRWNR